MAEVQSLLVPNDDSKVQRLRAEVQLLRFRSVTLRLTRVTSTSRSPVSSLLLVVTDSISKCDGTVVTHHGFTAVQVQDVKFSYHGLREHTA
jgi:hypothetical protein